MIVLDTNVVAEMMRPVPDAQVQGWLDRQPSSKLWLTAVTVGELEYGIALLPDGRKRDALAQGLETFIEEDLAGRVLPFDHQAARRYGPIVAARRRAGRPVALPDGQIAAISLLRSAALATRNIRDFDALGLTVIDPWEG